MDYRRAGHHRDAPGTSPKSVFTGMRPIDRGRAINLHVSHGHSARLGARIGFDERERLGILGEASLGIHIRAEHDERVAVLRLQYAHRGVMDGRGRTAR